MYPTQLTDQSPENSPRSAAKAPTDRSANPVDAARLAVAHAVNPGMAAQAQVVVEQEPFTPEEEPISSGIRFGQKMLDGLLNTIWTVVEPVTDVPARRDDFTLAA